MNRDWSNITLKEFYKIQEIIEVQDEWTMYNLLDYLYDIDSAEMPVSKVKQYSLGFLNENIDDIDISKFNDPKYDTNLDLTKVTVAQFVDYNNYIKEKNNFEKILSVFIVPKGHTYNDGYDLKEVQEDILNWPFAVTKKIAFFFIRQLQTFVTLFLHYLKDEVKGTNKEKEIQQILDKTNLMLSELSPIS